MGLFDEIAGKAMGMFGGAEGEDKGLLNGLVEMVSGGGAGGGLQGLVQTFQEKGLGDEISSWVGTGQNLPISPEQLKEGLGSDVIQNLAAKAGVSPDEVTAKLSEHLPSFVDKLTPDGVVPEGGMMEQALNFFKSKLS